MTSPPLLVADAVTRRFGTGAAMVTAIDGVDLEVHRGEILVLRGRSGSGKTTLLSLLGGLDTPTGGAVRFEGRDLAATTAAERIALRRSRFGFVFQSFGLVPLLTAAENVEVPLRLQRTDPVERTRRVAAALDAVGLSRAAAQRPDELSGGQRQRVGIARALITDPDVLIADEPTGQLDTATGARMLHLLTAATRASGAAAVIATHDEAVIASADRIIELRDGRRV